MNRFLLWTLRLKIVLTIFLWGLPLLFLPVSWAKELGFIFPQPVFFARLLGMAYLALVYAYLSGLRQAQAGKMPVAIINLGILSNAGATCILILTFFSDSYGGFSVAMKVYLFASAFVTAGISLSLGKIAVSLVKTSSIKDPL